MADRKLVYGSSTQITWTGTSLGTSATWVAGRESTSVSNASPLVLDYIVDGVIRVGTTPTTNTIIEVWCIPKLSSGSWPDVFDGTDSAETVTSRAILTNIGGRLATIFVDSNTTDRDYFFWGSIVQSMRGPCPKEWVLFITHNTGVNLNATAGQHVIYYTPVYESIS